MATTCAHCDQSITEGDDSIECELHDGRIEHMDCHSDRGCDWNLTMMPDRALLALHTKECIEAAMSDAPGAHDDESAFDTAAQMIDDGTYECSCPDKINITG